MMYKIIHIEPGDGECERESLSEYVTGVFGDVALWDDNR